MKNLTKKEWKDLYIKRLQKGGYSKKIATEAYRGMEEIDYEEDPIYSAEEELSS